MRWKIVNKKVSAVWQLMMLRNMTMIRSRWDLRMPRGDRRLVRRWNFRILLAAMTRWFSSHTIFRALFFTFVKVKKMSVGLNNVTSHQISSLLGIFHLIFETQVKALKNPPIFSWLPFWCNHSQNTFLPDNVLCRSWSQPDHSFL